MTRVPRCLHGNAWNTCETCMLTAWCEECGAAVVVDEPLNARETITCERCVDIMIGRTVEAQT